MEVQESEMLQVITGTHLLLLDILLLMSETMLLYK